jgi:hypothetical protein
MRQVTFHAKLGLWAVPQILVQSQTYTNIFAIAGARPAAQGTVATLLHQFSRLNRNPKILDHMDKIASKFGWRPGEWKESMETLERTGFGNVAGEHAFIDDFYSPQIVSSGRQQFLDWGAIFFRGAERNVRFGAWHTAFKEFRKTNPTGRLTDGNIRSILERADVLTANMSRASASRLHTGVFSIPGQFYSYQLRVAELFMGKRLSFWERARMLSTYAMMYGVPTAGGLVGVPVGDYFRKMAVENGYVAGDDFVNSMFMEGIPSMMMSLATGQVWNVGDRYGVQGFEFLREALRSDQPWWEIVGGASYSVGKGIAESMDGFTRSMVSLMTDDGASFPMAVEDVLDAAKEATSVNKAWQTITAIHTGRWMSKKGSYLTDASPAQAIFMGITGLQPQQVSDAYLLSWSQKDQLELEKWARERFIKEFRRGLNAMDETNDPKQFQKHMTRAQAYLAAAGYPEHKIGDLISLASKDHESLIERMNWDFYVKSPIPSLRESGLDRFRRIQELNKERNY